MSGTEDGFDRDSGAETESPDESWRSDGGRAGLEAGAGLEIEDEEPAEPGAVSGADIEADAETPSWLKSGGLSEEAVWPAGHGGDELEPESDTSNDGNAPTWIEIDAEFWGEENERAPDGDIEAQPAPAEPDAEDKAEAPRKPVIVHESRRTRRILIIIASIAAGIAIISTYMFSNGIGIFAPAGPGAPPDQEAPGPDNVIESVAWATAGEGYQDLFALISKQIRGASHEEDGAGQWDYIPVGDDPADIQHYYDGGEGYSGIDYQLEGIREGDIVKTDGSYIYSINSDSLYIVRADGGGLEVLSEIAQPSEDEKQVYFEMFVAGDRLVAVRQGLNKPALQKTRGMGDTEIPVMSIWYPFGGQIIDTSIDIFDISDRASPVKLHTLSQSGSYASSRMAGGYLYLISTYYGEVSQMDGGDPMTFVPLYARDGEQFMPGESDIFIPPDSQWPCYTVIAGIDVLETGDFVSLKSVYGDIGSVYTGHGAVYLTRTAYEEIKEPAGTLPPMPGTDGPELEYVEYTNWSETLISKLTIDSGRVEPRAQARVPGYMLNQISMDEHNGVLRLVATIDFNVWYGFKNNKGSYNADDWARLPQSSTELSNALYTLDEELRQLGVIEDITPNDNVHSGRFMGDVAYIKAWYDTRPFSVDLSDPAAPRIASAMTMQRLPDFLRWYSDGRLFGFGRDVDPDTGVFLGLKLNMFDSSDPADPVELHAYSLEGESSAADHSFRAVLVSSERGLVGIPALNGYCIFGYDDAKGFSEKAVIDYGAGDHYWFDIRGIIIGDTFYLVGPNNIDAYALGGGFGQSGSLRLAEGAGSVHRWSFGGPADIVPAGGEAPEEAPPDMPDDSKV